MAGCSSVLANSEEKCDGLQVRKATKDPRAQQEIQVFREATGTWASLDHKGILVPTDHLGQRASRAKRGLLDPKARQGHQGHTTMEQVSSTLADDRTRIKMALWDNSKCQGSRKKHNYYYFRACHHQNRVQLSARVGTRRCARMHGRRRFKADAGHFHTRERAVHT